VSDPKGQDTPATDLGPTLAELGQRVDQVLGMAARLRDEVAESVRRLQMVRASMREVAAGFWTTTGGNPPAKSPPAPGE
jgi:hypothetical protein